MCYSVFGYKAVIMIVNPITRKRLLQVLLTSSVIFVSLVAISYFFSLKPGNSFELGLPFKFYYQFPTQEEMLHGTIPIHFVYDAAIVFSFTVLIFIWVWSKSSRNETGERPKFIR